MSDLVTVISHVGSAELSDPAVVERMIRDMLLDDSNFIAGSAHVAKHRWAAFFQQAGMADDPFVVELLSWLCSGLPLSFCCPQDPQKSNDADHDKKLRGVQHTRWSFISYTLSNGHIY